MYLTNRCQVASLFGQLRFNGELPLSKCIALLLRFSFGKILDELMRPIDFPSQMCYYSIRKEQKSVVL
jgi:hypothetical protein